MAKQEAGQSSWKRSKPGATAAVPGYRTHIVVLVAGLAVQKLNASEGREGQFEQGDMSGDACLGCQSASLKTTQIVGSAGGSARRVRTRDMDEMEGVIRKKKEEDAVGLVSIPVHKRRR